MKHTHLHTRLLALLLCCALVLPLSACGEAKSTTQQIFAMDTVMDLTAYGKKADDGINAAISIINSMDTLLDPENERSKTYEINHAMGSPVVVNEQITKMLRTALTVKSTYTAVSDRIGDYKRLLEDFNEKVVKRGRIDPAPLRGYAQGAAGRNGRQRKLPCHHAGRHGAEFRRSGQGLRLGLCHSGDARRRRHERRCVPRRQRAADRQKAGRQRLEHPH